MSNNVVTYIYKRYCHIAHTDLQIFHHAWLKYTEIKLTLTLFNNIYVTSFKRWRPQTSQGPGKHPHFPPRAPSRIMRPLVGWLSKLATD